ncbi:MAG TPA: hypothetical protein VGR57_11030 [Ktedonobacterales bacterium]|nr:hypothetical protein [Ktedonobacterales bacterium]
MKRLVVILTVATFLVFAVHAAALASPGASVVGTFAFADHGQGGWAGGPLLSDGTLGGSGAFSFSTPQGQVVAKITNGFWSGTLATGQTVTLCANLQQIQGPPGFLPPTVCAPFPVNAGSVNLFGDSFGRVTTTG